MQHPYHRQVAGPQSQRRGNAQMLGCCIPHRQFIGLLYVEWAPSTKFTQPKSCYRTV